MVQNWIVVRSTARNFTVCIYWIIWFFSLYHPIVWPAKIISSKIAKFWFFKVIFGCSVKSIWFFFWKLDFLNNQFLSAQLWIGYYEKLMISYQWTCGFMANMDKKSWTVSSLEFMNFFANWTLFRASTFHMGRFFL